MTADELRLWIADFLRDELELDVTVQGKRIVVDSGGDLTIVLVTAATRERLLRELRNSRASRPQGLTG